MKVEPMTLGVVMTTIGSGASAFSTYLPRLSEIRRSDASVNANMVGDVRLGELAATVTAMAVGAIASALTGSVTPIVASALFSAIMVTIFEYALSGSHLFEETLNV